jgi:hypothetical protein
VTEDSKGSDSTLIVQIRLHHFYRKAWVEHIILHSIQKWIQNFFLHLSNKPPIRLTEESRRIQRLLHKSRLTRFRMGTQCVWRILHTLRSAERRKPSRRSPSALN